MIVDKLVNAFPNLAGKKAYANYSVLLCDSITNIPPGIGQSVGLVIIYLNTISIIFLLLFFPAYNFTVLRYWCTELTAVDPCPTAIATRLITP